MLSNNGRRSKIRAPKKNLANEVDFEQSWELLSSAIKEIVNKNASKLSFEELYRKSYNLVLRKFGKQLYESVKVLIGDHLDTIRNKINLELKSANHDKLILLKQVSSYWADHLLSMRMISDVFMYLDRVYAKENRLPLIYDVGINLFRDKIIKADDRFIGVQLSYILIEQIALNRNGLITDIFLTKSIITMFESLIEDEKNVETGENYYLKYFEPFYLDKTLDYYEKISVDIFEQQNGIIYIREIDQLILNETNKSVLYLPNVTHFKLQNLVDKVLITSKIDKVMSLSNDGLKSWILYEKFDELRLLYKLLSRVDYFDGFKIQLSKIIMDDGLLIEQETELANQQQQLPNPQKGSKSKKITVQAITWIERIITLKDKYDSILLKSFHNDVNIQKTIENSFVEFLNKNVKLSEYLSLYIDDHVKKSNDKTEEEIDSIINKATVIFRFVKDKDLFEKYYKNHLAKRLLRNTNNNDLEKTIISKIKNEIGSNFTSKLEGMFRDINLSKELTMKFQEKTFEINVLTKTFWPMQPSSNLQEVLISPRLFNLQRKFNDFYLNLHNGRNLTWAYNFGSIDIRIKFSKKIHELNMSLYCGSIVLLFEENDELTYEEISILTKIPEVDLIRSLQSIAVAPRTRILTKTPMSKDIKKDDVFKFNYDFSAPMTKIKVLTVANKVETDSERSKTIEKIEEERKFELDAAIVRIMKSRKILSHNELIIETVKQITRFKPSPQFIKKRIDALLEREYLQRDTEDRSVYQYLA